MSIIDDDACFECGAPAECRHHVVPRIYGGTRTVPLCEGCHHKAHGRDGRSAWTGRATRAAMQSMKARGLYTGGRVRYGYRVGDDGVLVEDEGEQVTLAMVRELRGAGLSLRKVAAELERRGMVNRNGSRFGPSTLARLEEAAA